MVKKMLLENRFHQNTRVAVGALLSPFIWVEPIPILLIFVAMLWNLFGALQQPILM